MPKDGGVLVSVSRPAASSVPDEQADPRLNPDIALQVTAQAQRFGANQQDGKVPINEHEPIISLAALRPPGQEDASGWADVAYRLFKSADVDNDGAPRASYDGHSIAPRCTSASLAKCWRDRPCREAAAVQPPTRARNLYSSKPEAPRDRPRSGNLCPGFLSSVELWSALAKLPVRIASLVRSCPHLL